MDKRRKWISVLLEEGLQVGVLHPGDILSHATPAVLATDLPPMLVASVLQAGLDGDGFNPDVVVHTLGTEALAEHLPLPVLWTCIQDAASVIIGEHPLEQRIKKSDTAEHDVHDVLAPSAVEAIDMPDIEVLEE